MYKRETLVGGSKAEQILKIASKPILNYVPHVEASENVQLITVVR